MDHKVILPKLIVRIIYTVIFLYLYVVPLLWSYGVGSIFIKEQFLSSGRGVFLQVVGKLLSVQSVGCCRPYPKLFVKEWLRFPLNSLKREYLV